MSHIVIHDDHAGITQYRQFDDVSAAAGYLEELHNEEGIEDAQLFALDAVEFAVKSYVRVEIGASSDDDGSDADDEDGDETDDAESSSRWARDRSEPQLEEMADADPESMPEPADTDGDDDIEYVDASSQDYLPPELGPEPEDEPVAATEVRRGLFGR